ncbi:interleukin-7 receptor subunit alpha isoform X2 [Genypterus blacodes]|uniref:interleukin-7 receptor subunit alpha isoform X2 n=1 Tax=Genypterus blacodes TaxID=154954 RepID=UPI003F762690
MLFGGRVSVLLLLLPNVTHSQSGDGHSGAEPRISCSSQISQKAGNSLTCKLDSGSNVNEDDEDNEGYDIEKMTACSLNMITNTQRCVDGSGDTIRSTRLRPITATFNLTIQLKSGSRINRLIDLKKIVKPKPPQVLNVTRQLQSHQVVIYLSSYKRDYLHKQNQLFQYEIRSLERTMVENVTGSDTLSISMDHLQKNTEYQVKVRAIPNSQFEGMWSDWSGDFTFSTYTEVKEQPDNGWVVLYMLLICLTSLILLTGCTVFWKKKLYTYLWPSIPQPKDTLVKIYKPIKNLPTSFIPAEVFSDFKIYPVEKIEQQHCGETEPTAPVADITQSKEPCSPQSSDCSKSNTSVSTEELDVSTLFSRSSAGEEEEYFQSRSSTPTGALQPEEEQPVVQPEYNVGDNEQDMFGVTQQVPDEDYVTMSSFYQIK